MNTRYRFQRVTIPASWDHWEAFLAFQAMGPEGKSAIPDLVNLANDPSTNSSPSGTGEAPPISFWKDQKRIPIFAAQSSTYLSHGSPVIPVKIFFGGGWIPQPFLSDGEIAAWSLAAIGADSVPPLMQMLTNSDPRLRCWAATALGMMGKAAEPAVPALVKELDDWGGSTSAERRHLDPYAYWPSPGSVPFDPVSNARREAADALGCIGQQPDLVVPVLIKVFGDYDVESTAIGSLGAFGERATNAIPALLTFFQTEYNSPNQTRGQYRIDDVALALNKISPETTRKEVMPLLIYRIRNPKSPWNQSMTLNTLGQMTNQPNLVIPVLLKALDSTNNYIRSTIVYQLADFGPAAKSAIPKLISFSTGQDTNLCRLATNTLDKIEPGWRTSH
jgi:HEAT repeat protein